MSTKYKVLWDNGCNASETFSTVFDTFEEADAYGRDWAYESNVRDFGNPDGPEDDDGYSYEVITYEVDDPDECDGHAHYQTRQENL